jgi:uncharacterized protein (TIGR02284 family)
MKSPEALNDLIEINNDRVVGYEKAAAQADDSDLKEIFNANASESKRFAEELRQLAEREGSHPAEGTTFRGKIYRTWMDVKATFGGDSRHGVLASCEFGEDAAQRAYNTALDDKDLNAEERALLEKQKQVLRSAHDRIKSMRDSEPTKK